ncbi:ABC transporter substrate-binding protein [Hymenobacter koreensis]|uniref:Peptide ABC transporter substrate-binding protein n=1 Tax=Hymenobacter koreensis TaxID=1084523 RepID=A0ABP8IWB2_9BACT
MLQLLSRGVILLLASCLIACSTPTARTTSPATVRVCWPRDPESLNPIVWPNTYAVQLNNLLYQSLLVVDGTRRQYVPWLVENVPQVSRRDSVTAITYRLRQAAIWDNGQPITARDVLFTLRLLRCPGVPNERIGVGLSFIRDIQLDSVDARRFTFICNGFAPEYATNSGDFPILPEYLLDPKGLLREVPLAELSQSSLSAGSQRICQAFAEQYNRPEQWRDPQHVRGSGPYELESWQTGQKLVLRRKATWWADQLQPAPPMLVARPTRLEFHIIPDPTTALLALRRGDVDVYPNVPAADFQRLQNSPQAGQFQFFAPASYRMLVLEMNVQRPIIRDAATRQALLHLIDVPALMRATQNQPARRTVSIISPLEKWAYNDSLPLRTYAPQRAASLLRQAGWQRTSTTWQRRTASGKTEELAPRLHYRAGERTLETAALQFQQAAAKEGIRLTLLPSEASLLAELRRKGNYELVFRTFYGNPFSYDLRQVLHTNSIGVPGGNTSGFGTKSSDALLEMIATAEDSMQKAKLLRRLQSVLYQEAPLNPLFFEPNRLIVAKRFADIRPAGPEPGYNLASFSESTPPNKR